MSEVQSQMVSENSGNAQEMSELQTVQVGSGSKKKKKKVRKRSGREITRKYVWEYLLAHPCVGCGERDPVVLDFDHVKGQKKNGVSEMVNDEYGLELIKEEIEKCVVRCANCHRRRTARIGKHWKLKFGWYRHQIRD